MGFRTGSYAKVWAVEPKSDTYTKLRISTGHKDKQGGYEQDFSGYVSVFGTAAAGKAAKLQNGDTIRLGDVDVTTTYNAQTKAAYTNFKCFSFDIPDKSGNGSGSGRVAEEKEADGGEIEEPSDLPF